jgi:hypothetical protein
LELVEPDRAAISQPIKNALEARVSSLGRPGGCLGSGEAQGILAHTLGDTTGGTVPVAFRHGRALWDDFNCG